VAKRTAPRPQGHPTSPFIESITMNTTRAEYTAKMKRQLDELNTRIDTLQAKALETREDIRAAYQADLVKARHESKLAMAKFEEMKVAGEESWDKMVAEMDRIRDAFVHSFKYFKSQI